MDIKNRLILILIILTIIFFMGTIRSCSTGKKLKTALGVLNKEKADSWDLEQRLSELKKDKAVLEKELEETRVAYQGVKKTLLQEQLVSQGVQEELQKTTKLKEALEEDLKEALIKNKSTKLKR